MLLLQNQKIRKKIMEVFISDNFPDVRRIHNSSGHWINVPTPEKISDSEYRLGFNMDSGYVHDFTTQESCSFFDFVAKYLDISYAETDKFLFDIAINQKLLSLDNLPESEQAEPKPELPKELITFPEIQLPPHTIYIDMNAEIGISAPAVKYLKGRGITQELVDFFEIRYCFAGKYGGRVIFPIRDVDGKIVMFQGRAISDNLQPKYLFSTGGNKKHVAYNAYRIPENQTVIVCEGIFDVIAAHKAGYYAVATFGNSLTFFHQSKISTRRPNKIILAYDVDAAGVLGLVNAGKLLDDYFVVNYPDNVKDFGDANVEQIHDIIEHAKPWSNQTFMQFLLTASLLEGKKNVEL